MGSPYNVCTLNFKGKWQPILPSDYEWQDLSAQSPNKRYLALIAWAIENNSPGFHIVVIDLKHKSIQRSPRIVGICMGIAWWGDILHYEVSKVLNLAELIEI
ncbi:hypothetical protein TI04_08595 [Achromatium sp. WMS2]|nr:hypothetical protein TI04_08595 [Achromatium sp. WMS2]